MPLEDLRFLRFKRAGQLIDEASRLKGDKEAISTAVNGLGSALMTNGLVNALLLQRAAASTQQPQAEFAAAALVIWLQQRFSIDDGIGTVIGDRQAAQKIIDAAVKALIAFDENQERQYRRIQEEALVFAGQIKLVAKAGKAAQVQGEGG